MQIMQIGHASEADLSSAHSCAFRKTSLQQWSAVRAYAELAQSEAACTATHANAICRHLHCHIAASSESPEPAVSIHLAMQCPWICSHKAYHIILWVYVMHAMVWGILTYTENVGVIYYILIQVDLI